MMSALLYINVVTISSKKKETTKPGTATGTNYIIIHYSQNRNRKIRDAISILTRENRSRTTSWERVFWIMGKKASTE